MRNAGQQMDPSPDEIRREYEWIRRGWTRNEERKRMGCYWPRLWTVPETAVVDAEKRD